MNTPRQDISIARFDFGALHDFSRPFTPRESIREPEIVAPVEPPPPPPPTYSQQQMEQAMADAREQGRQQGLIEGREQADQEAAQRQQAIQQSLSAIALQMQMAQGTFFSYLKDRQRDMTQLSVAVAKQVCATALKYYPAAQFESLVARCLPIILRQPRLIVSVHPEQVEVIEESVRQMRMETGYEGQVEVRAHTALHAHDAKIHWEDGAAEIRGEELWRSVEAVLLDQTAAPATENVTPEIATPAIPIPLNPDTRAT